MLEKFGARHDTKNTHVVLIFIFFSDMQLI